MFQLMAPSFRIRESPWHNIKLKHTRYLKNFDLWEWQFYMVQPNATERMWFWESVLGQTPGLLLLLSCETQATLSGLTFLIHKYK